MITYGFAKDCYYTNDGTLMIQVRVPSIHGPYSKSDYRGKLPRNYVPDSDLPYYPALLMHHLPGDGEVVAITSLDNSNSSFLVLGLTGGAYISTDMNNE